MNRRQWLKTAAMAAAPRVRPNVLIVLADQFPAYALACAGDPNARTPRFDRMAREGARFVNAVSNCPVCTPFRSMLQTGRWPLATGMIANDIRLPESEYTMGEAFRDAGYQTGYIGKWHMDGPQRWAFTPPGPRRQGYEFWAVNNCSHSYLDTFYYRDTPERIPVKEYEPLVQTRLFQEFLSKRDRGRPFFMTLSWGPPHPPYDQIPEALRVFKAEDMKTRPNMEEPKRQFLADFYSHIAAIDTEMGRMLDSLEKEGVLDDTIVLFSADHGDMLSSHGKTDKQMWYEESVNIPFLLRYPRRVPAGSTPATMVNVVDVMPTLLSLAEVAVPKSVQGKDLSAAASGKGAGQDASLIAAYMPFSGRSYGYPEWRGVRTATHTYVETLRDAPLLFDNRRDPYQLKNLAGEADQKGLRSKMAGRLKELLAATGDRFEPRENYWKRYGLDIGNNGEVKYTSREGGK